MAKRKFKKAEGTPRPSVMNTTDNVGERPASQPKVVEKASNFDSEVYSAYVRGERINDIAAGSKVSSQEVLDAINRVEAKR